MRHATVRCDDTAVSAVAGSAPTHRRAGVLRRALRGELRRLRDPHRIAALAIFVLVGGGTLAGMIARGEAGGADARAYWAAVRIWLNGGDPYNPSGPFMPYVYPPWMLPLFAPWALLPWEVAWFAWRGATIGLLAWMVAWAYRRRHLETALVLAVLAFPFGANLDTGNVNILLAAACWGAQFTGPRTAGLLWALATWMKWVPAPLFLVLAPRARRWGLGWLGVCALLSLATLPGTVEQLQALLGFGPRPIRLDYLVLLWAAVPWWWRHPRPLWWLRPNAWPGIVAPRVTRLRTLAGALRGDPRGTVAAAGRDLVAWGRAFIGIDETAAGAARAPR